MCKHTHVYVWVGETWWVRALCSPSPTKRGFAHVLQSALKTFWQVAMNALEVSSLSF